MSSCRAASHTHTHRRQLARALSARASHQRTRGLSGARAHCAAQDRALPASNRTAFAQDQRAEREPCWMRTG
eukprot:241308-Rhodomonas_salina.2